MKVTKEPKEIEPKEPVVSEKSKQKSVRELIKIVNTRALMLGVLSVALLIAILPQFGYEYMLWRDPNFQLSWQWRDRFLLFSFTSHLTIIMITVATIMIYLSIAKVTDLVQMMMNQTANDTTWLIKKFKQIGYDLESIEPFFDMLVETYHHNKKDLQAGRELFAKFILVLPAMQELYGERLEKLSKMDKEHQKEVLKEFVDKVM